MQLDTCEEGGCPRIGMIGATTNFGYGFSTVQDPVWTLSQVLLATGGRLVSGFSGVGFRSIATDSRSLQPGDLFLALSGDCFDGHDFVEDAIQRGAAGLIVSKPGQTEFSAPVVLVDDPLRALGDLAAYRRRLMPDLRVLAITGSTGKTTVKEMTGAIFAEKFHVLKTRGNFNNLIGMPMTLLRVDYRHDVAILEMGMNRPGEIDRLTEIADPDICCIVNVHDAHLAGLKDIEGVARAKGEMFAACKSWARLVVNFDDLRVRALSRQYSQEKITFGRHAKAMIRATHIRNCGEEGMVFTLHLNGLKERIQIRALGAHNVMNSLAAAAMAYAADVDMDQIVRGLQKFSCAEKRLQIESVRRLKIVNDAYNANPASMAAAFATMKGLKGQAKSVAVLGDMLELGEESKVAHRRLGENAACAGFDYVLTVGRFSHIVAQGALDAGMSRRQVRDLASKEEMVEALNDLLQLGELVPGDWLLVKGSRSMAMEQVISGLRNGEEDQQKQQGQQDQ